MKNVEDTHTTVTEDKKFYVQTEDGETYVFFFLPWHDKPLFSHRFTPGNNKEKGERDFVNRLPTKVRHAVEDEFGGYFKQLLSEYER